MFVAFGCSPATAADMSPNRQKATDERMGGGGFGVFWQNNKKPNKSIPYFLVSRDTRHYTVQYSNTQ